MSERTVITVCTHNRTRSVLMGALLQWHLDALSPGPVWHVATGGFREEGLPPTPDTVRRLGAIGLDVAAHRSSRVTTAQAAAADLVVTAERDHVVRLAGDRAAVFAHTFTLPELVQRIEVVSAPMHLGLTRWLQHMGVERATGATYLRGVVPELLDPTGAPRVVWDRVVAQVDHHCRVLARSLVDAEVPT